MPLIWYEFIRFRQEATTTAKLQCFFWYDFERDFWPLNKEAVIVTRHTQHKTRQQPTRLREYCCHHE